MPLYEYVCSKCQKTFEELVREGEEPLCPSCGDSAVSKVLSVVSVGRQTEPSPCGSCPSAGGGSCPYS